MSAESEVITRRHFEYIAARTVQEDDFLRDLKAQALEAGIPRQWISPEQASLMQILLRVAGAREVVEVGTLAGYSAISMARALPDGGRVRAIEIDPSRAAFAQEWADRDLERREGKGGRVEVLVGPGAEILPTLADESADACFLDADKGGYVGYVNECLRIVRPGGLFMVDNAFAFGELFAEEPKDRETAAVRAFNEHMAAIPELQSIIVAIGDGCWVGVRLGRCPSNPSAQETASTGQPPR